jgi:hypothetical protein
MVTFSSGRSELIYRAPFPAEGPVRGVDRVGNEAWVFMYAHFVFHWVEGSSHVQVSHGTIGGPKTLLWADIQIPGRWSGAVLAEFGRRWVIAHLEKFRL